MVIIESDSSSIVSAITNTILRDHYNYVHKEFANKVLKASNISRGVFKFFENNFVEDDTGTRWNSFAITRFMGEYLKQTESYYQNKDEFEKYSARLQELSLMDETDEKMAERKKLKNLLVYINYELLMKRVKLAILSKNINLYLKVLQRHFYKKNNY